MEAMEGYKGGDGGRRTENGYVIGRAAEQQSSAGMHVDHKLCSRGCGCVFFLRYATRIAYPGLLLIFPFLSDCMSVLQQWHQVDIGRRSIEIRTSQPNLSFEQPKPTCQMSCHE